jgi:hypothetical protein
LRREAATADDQSLKHCSLSAPSLQAFSQDQGKVTADMRVLKLAARRRGGTLPMLREHALVGARREDPNETEAE